MSTRAVPEHLVTVASAGAPEELSRAAISPVDHAAVRAIVAGIMLAMFLSALEQTIVAPALPAIARSLGGIDDLSWVVTAYLLAVTATTPLFGKLSDIYGRRVVLLWAIGIFIGGSIADDLELGVRARAARHRRRRLVADRPDYHCRFIVAPRTADRSGPDFDHVYERQHHRSSARRISHRSAALVVDLLDQSAARGGGAGHERARCGSCRATSGRTSST